MKNDLVLSRRQLLQWSTPAITAVTLPAHADMSADMSVMVCQAAPPVLTVVAPPKCSGTVQQPTGTAVVEITSGSSVDVMINDIVVTTSDPKSTISSVPSFPFTVSDMSGETFTWIGPGSDLAKCLPLASISLTIEYSCDDQPSESTVYDLTKLLVESVP